MTHHKRHNELCSRYIAAQYNTILNITHNFESKTSLPLRIMGVFRDSFWEKWPLDIRSVLCILFWYGHNNVIYQPHVWHQLIA